LDIAEHYLENFEKLKAAMDAGEAWKQYSMRLSELRAFDLHCLAILKQLLSPDSEMILTWYVHESNRDLSMGSHINDMDGKIGVLRMLLKTIGKQTSQPSRQAEAMSEDIASDTVRYDVALSFAGEDRVHARRIAELIRHAGFTVFYDEYEQSSLWGKNLYSHLSDVYQNKARYCLMFISESYAKKLWTKRERESAQARAFREGREYILPLRLDDTALPGVEDTVGYIDLRHTPIDEVLRFLIEKLNAYERGTNAV